MISLLHPPSPTSRLCLVNKALVRFEKIHPDVAARGSVGALQVYRASFLMRLHNSINKWNMFGLFVPR